MAPQVSALHCAKGWRKYRRGYASEEQVSSFHVAYLESSRGGVMRVCIS